MHPLSGQILVVLLLSCAGLCRVCGSPRRDALPAATHHALRPSKTQAASRGLEEICSASFQSIDFTFSAPPGVLLLRGGEPGEDAAGGAAEGAGATKRTEGVPARVESGARGAPVGSQEPKWGSWGSKIPGYHAREVRQGGDHEVLLSARPPK